MTKLSIPDNVYRWAHEEVGEEYGKNRRRFLMQCEAFPELLESSKNVLAWLREFYADEPLFSREPNHANATITALEAAIAKAEGGQ